MIVYYIFIFLVSIFYAWWIWEQNKRGVCIMPELLVEKFGRWLIDYYPYTAIGITLCATLVSGIFIVVNILRMLS